MGVRCSGDTTPWRVDRSSVKSLGMGWYPCLTACVTPSVCFKACVTPAGALGTASSTAASAQPTSSLATRGGHAGRETDTPVLQLRAQSLRSSNKGLTRD